MEFDSPDVEKDFPGLYASETSRKGQSRDSDYSDEEKASKKDLLGKKREKRESKKDKGYVAFEGESSGDEADESNPGKSKKSKSSAFKFPGKEKKEKHNKIREKEGKEKKEEKEKVCKKESKDGKKEVKDSEKVKDKIKIKKKKESKLLKIKEKKKKSNEQGNAGDEEKPIFGIPLSLACERSKSHDGIEIPVVVRECIDYIEEHGLACEGIYRISGLKSKLRQLKSQYNSKEKVYLYEHEPHIVASLLKQFLRDLPESILTTDLLPKFEEAAALKNEKKREETLMKLLEQLPNCNRLLLSWIFVHMLHVVKMEKRNKMNLQNVSIVLSPTLQISHHILQALFAHSNVLFKGVEIKKYIPPIELDSNRLSLELPDSPSAIAEELSKQENFLNILHAELNAGLRDQQKEEQLWEVQRVVTQLKRKLRFLRQVQDSSNPTVDEVQIKPKPEEVEKSTINAILQQQSSDLGTSPLSEVQEKSKEPESLPCLTKSESFPITAEKNGREQNVSEVRVKSISPLPDVPPKINSINCTVSKEERSISPAVEQDEKTDFERPADPIIIEKYLNAVPPESPVLPIENLQELEERNLVHSLLHEEKMLHVQHDELILLGDELRRKINSEKLEIERLRSEIAEYQQLYKYKRYSFDSTENSSSDSDDTSSSDGEDEEDLCNVLEYLIKENKLLEIKNMDLSKVIQYEREVCLNIKVQMKMIQQNEAKPLRA
ncbi:ralA-binding protein 1-like isoform X2 [Uloborus diversus]|uniref:ralA-binding protein 1-like isoform X2 n=1 Tax=Uloborus diversus TaxID=327109 RepID=UPI002409FAD1|nr:ralA-binding protein 1-like isoform X2 [Uloborus diversus]